MSSKKTEHLKLHAWEPFDPFTREEFNDNFAKLDAAVESDREGIAAARSELAAGDSAVRAEFAAADNAVRAAFAAADSSLKSELQSAISGVDSRVTGASSTLSGLQATVSGIQTALGSGGSTCRIATGTYTGNGKCGSKNANSIKFDFKPYLVLIGSIENAANLFWPAIMIRDVTGGKAEDRDVRNTVTWGDNSVSWYNDATYGESIVADYQNNVNNRVYYYVALGVSS